MRLHPLALALACAASIPFGAAAQDAGDIFSFSGFGTIGVVHSSEDRADFIPGDAPDGPGATDRWSTTPDTRLAAQVDARFSDKLSAVVQVMSEYDAEGSYGPTVELAHVKYAFTPALSLRVGRYTAPIFMLSEYRKVGYAMPWVRPPSEVYNNSVALDGADLSYKFNLGATAMTLQAVAGDGDEVVYKLRQARGISVRAERGSSSMFASYNKVRIDLTSPEVAQLLGYYEPHFPEITERYHVYDNKVTFASLGYAYDPGDWFARAEATRTSGEKGMVGGSTNIYLSAGLRRGAFTPYATYGKVDTDGPATLGAADPIGVVNGVLASANHARQSLTLGSRWDVRANVAVKLEVAHVEADDDSFGGLYNAQPGFEPGGSYDVLSASVDFVF